VNDIVSKDGIKPENHNVEDDELLKNAEKLVESLETVQDIDPSEKELSTIWQNLIASLRLGHSIHPQLPSTVKDLTPIEARILLGIKEKNVGVFFKMWRLFRDIIFSDMESYGIKRNR
jgi:hypothetical protein